jgi:hypothetical protein
MPFIPYKGRNRKLGRALAKSLVSTSFSGLWEEAEDQAISVEERWKNVKQNSNKHILRN